MSSMQHVVRAKDLATLNQAEDLVKKAGFLPILRNEKRLFFSTAFLPIHIVAQLHHLGASVNLDQQSNPD